MNDLTIQELQAFIAYFEKSKTDPTEADLLPIRMARQLLTLMERNTKDDRQADWYSPYLTSEQIEDVHRRMNREVSKEAIVKIADLFFDHLKLTGTETNQP